MFMVISGVPELPNEDTGSLALEVAKAAGVTLSADDLDRSHRLGRPSTATSTATIDKPRAILVKFGVHQKRQNLFSARKNLSGHRVAYHPVLTSQVLDKVYISDFLTPKGQNMLYICRQLKRGGHIWAAYVQLKRQGDNQNGRKSPPEDHQQCFGAPDHPWCQQLAYRRHSGGWP